MPAAVHILLLGSLMFGQPRTFPDLAMECGELAGAKADPIGMPRASAYLRSGRDGYAIEDRYDIFDLWHADAFRASWRDADGSRFMICRIPRKLPGGSASDELTRKDFRARYSGEAMGPDDMTALDEAVYFLAPEETVSRFRPRRSQRHNLAALWQYETTNGNALVYAFRPKTPRDVHADWYMAALVSEDPEASERMDEWIDGVRWSGAGAANGKGATGNSELDLLADDYRRNVVNYGDWHFTCSSNVVVVDNLSIPDRPQFIAALTNGLLKMQVAYREVLPSPLIDDSHIAAMRIFDSRTEYLDYVGWEMQWSAALWSPQHRELVLYCPPSGSAALLRTVWHEALHQHLGYACAMLQPPPWFNEGHAAMFENSHFGSGGEVVFDLDSEAVRTIKGNIEEMSEALRSIFAMDYEGFYAGTDEERALKYRLAWSLAYFLQVGAPEVRFQPFRNVRTSLMKALVRTRRMDDATREAIGGDMEDRLVGEWIEFWKRQ